MRKIKYGEKKGSISDILATVVPSVKGSVSSFAACAKPFNPGGTPHMKGVGMLVGNFELNP